jgi:phosphate-selective porin
LPVYTLLGIELAQGAGERFGTTLSPDEQEDLGLSETRGGPRLWTAFAKVAPDLGYNHALQLGLSYAHNSQQQSAYVLGQPPGLAAPALDPTGAGTEPQIVGLQGDADLWGVALVYKYDGEGAAGYHDFKLQSEYLREIQSMTAGGALPEAAGSDVTLTTDGLYAQAIYGVWPRWQLGVRYDVLGLTNRLSGMVDEDFGSSDRWTAALTWDLSEFSRLRLQYAKNDILAEPGERGRFDAFYLQFIMSMGTHGAHQF